MPVSKAESFIPLVSESEKPLFYYMALIDILTHYGMKKRTANAAKQVKHGSGAEISTVKPEQYAKRFTDFINKIIDWEKWPWTTLTYS